MGKIDYDRLNSAIAMLQNGARIEEVMQSLNYSKIGVIAIIKRNNINYETDKKKEIRLREREIIQLRKLGYSMSQIVDKTNYRFVDVSRACNKCGLGGKRANIKLEERICLECGKAFLCDPRSNKKYCTPACGKRAYHSKNDIIRKRLKNRQTIEKISLKEVADNDHNVCYLCGLPVDWNDYKIVNNKKIVFGNYPSIDHVIPLFHGGTHSWDNVRLAHIRCNASKGIKEVS